MKSHLVTVCAPGAGTPAAIAGFASVSSAAAPAAVALLSSELKGRRCRKLRRRVLQSKEKNSGNCNVFHILVCMYVNCKSDNWT